MFWVMFLQHQRTRLWICWQNFHWCCIHRHSFSFCFLPCFLQNSTSCSMDPITTTSPNFFPKKKHSLHNWHSYHDSQLHAKSTPFPHINITHPTEFWNSIISDQFRQEITHPSRMAGQVSFFSGKKEKKIPGGIINALNSISCIQCTQWHAFVYDGYFPPCNLQPNKCIWILWIANCM